MLPDVLAEMVSSIETALTHLAMTEGGGAGPHADPLTGVGIGAAPHTGTARTAASADEAIDKLEGVDRAMAERLHVIVLEEAPHLHPKTFYGFPAYAKDGKVVVFYQPASKFKTRYGTVSFDDTAHLDDGPMWPVSFAVVEVTAEVAKAVRDAVRRASPSE